MEGRRHLLWFNNGKYYTPGVTGTLQEGDLMDCNDCNIAIFQGHPLMVFTRMKPEEEIEIFEVVDFEPKPPHRKNLSNSSEAFCKTCRMGRKITKKSPEMRSKILRKIVANPVNRLISSVAIRLMELPENEAFILGLAGDTTVDYCLRMTAIQKLSPEIKSHREMLQRIVWTRNEHEMVHAMASKRFQGFNPAEEIPAIK